MIGDWIGRRVDVKGSDSERQKLVGTMKFQGGG